MNAKEEVEEGAVAAKCGLCVLLTVAMGVVVIAGLVVLGVGGL
jgi:hypothetical protein